MQFARPALAALLVGTTLLASPALLLQFQQPNECAHSVEPATETAEAGGNVPEFRYRELSPDAKRAFERAQSVDRSVTVYGERCPEELSYTAEQSRYEIVRNGSSYHLTTYLNDLVPEVEILAALVSFLGLSLLGVGVSTRDDSEARAPAWAGIVSLATLLGVVTAVLFDQQLWVAIGWTGVVTAGTLVGTGAALPPRRALVMGCALAALPAFVALPLVGRGVGMIFLGLGVVPLVLVGIGTAGRAFASRLRA